MIFSASQHFVRDIDGSVLNYGIYVLSYIIILENSWVTHTGNTVGQLWNFSENLRKLSQQGKRDKSC